jgi:hypothetical protein
VTPIAIVQVNTGVNANRVLDELRPGLRQDVDWAKRTGFALPTSRNVPRIVSLMKRPTPESDEDRLYKKLVRERQRRLFVAGFRSWFRKNANRISILAVAAALTASAVKEFVTEQQKEKVETLE